MSSQFTDLAGGSSGGGGGGGGGLSAGTGDIQFVTSVLGTPSVTEANGLRFNPMVKGAGEALIWSWVAGATGAVDIQIPYRMSAANGGDVYFRLDVGQFASGTDPTAALTTGTPFAITPGNDALEHTLSKATAGAGALGFSVTAGNTVVCRLNRVVNALDTHTADFRPYAVRTVG